MLKQNGGTSNLETCLQISWACGSLCGVLVAFWLCPSLIKRNLFTNIQNVPLMEPILELCKMFSFMELISNEPHYGYTTVVLQQCRSHMTDYEQDEIVRYNGIYFLGLHANKIQATRSPGSNNHGRPCTISVL